MNTDQAFEYLLTNKKLWTKTGLNQDRRRYFKHLQKEKKLLTLDKKVELLKSAGFVVQQEIEWKIPSI